MRIKFNGNCDTYHVLEHQPLQNSLLRSNVEQEFAVVQEWKTLLFRCMGEKVNMAVYIFYTTFLISDSY